ncbi:hypothetical protein Tco_1028653 [Tanacetum coccineum]|uniref:Uncharacterized protein n=1 Tax=Tanacetum coccineum TaxID=301880 RepID=A0ABQ5G3E2_9ASTR
MESEHYLLNYLGTDTPGESLNIQDVKTSLFWEFRKFTSHDGESIKLYYSRFYKMMNEMLAAQQYPEVLIISTKSKSTNPYAPPSKQSSSDTISPNAENQKGYKTTLYHKEKNVLNKQAEKGVSLQEEQVDWLEDIDEEIDEQELEAHYNYMAMIQERQHSEQPESINNTCVVEKVDSNVIPNSPDMCDNDIQTYKNAKECVDERVTLANLIANLTLYTKKNKKILKAIKKSKCIIDSNN